MHDRYLSFNDVAERLGIARSSIYRRIQDGTLPQPLKLGAVVRFKESEIDAALTKLENQRQK